MTHFFTGFPGFLTTQLVRRVLTADPGATVCLLVLPRMIPMALERREQLELDFPGATLELLEGDITFPWLGLGEARYDRLAQRISHVWHLAALYNLAVPRAIAYRVNVAGTGRILDLCQAARDLRRLNYISTCYVSGARVGSVLETELDASQSHRNHYEETKFWAEVEVQRRMAQIPTAIFRPSIVVGDSRTGHTDKYDGPYYVFQLLNRLPNWVPLAHVGDHEANVNLAPIDYVSQAMAYIGLKDGAQGSVYHLSDPRPMRTRDVLSLALDVLGKPPAKLRLPGSLLDAALTSARLEDALGLPREVLAYFNHDARYDTTNTDRALLETDIRCPHLSTYLPTLIEYLVAHPVPSVA